MDRQQRRGRLRLEMGVINLSWIFGSVWATATSGAPLTQFALSLKASNFQFGVLSALPFVASLVSLPSSFWIDRKGARKSIFLWSLYAQRLLWIPIALVPLWMVRSHGPQAIPAALTISLLLMFFMHSAGAVGGPAWISWMADVVPDRTRGKYFSRRRQWGILSAIPAAWLGGWLLDRPAVTHAINWTDVTLGWCAIIFLCSAVFGMVDIAMFQFVHHAPPRMDERPSFREMFSEPLRDRQFLWFGAFVATMTFAVSFMGQFLTLYLIDKLHVSNRATQMMLLIVPMLAQLIMLPAWGAATDRFGKRPILVISCLALVPVAFGWCLMSRGGTGSIVLGYILAAAGAALWTGVEVANFNLVLELSGAEGGAPASSYAAVNSVIINIAGCAGGLSAGVLGELLKNWSWHPNVSWFGTFTFYEVLFALSGVMRLISVVVFLPKIHEPEAGPTHAALRFITGNIYNNLYNAIFLPLRVIRSRREDD